MSDNPDAYKVLQVDPEADPEVIQAAYRRLAQKYHPDLAGEPNTEAGREAMSRMVAINIAWALLRDPARRAELDRERASHAGAGESGGEASGRDRPTHSGGSAPDSHHGDVGSSGGDPNRADAGANQSSWSARMSSSRHGAAGSGGARPTDTAGAAGGAASSGSGTAHAAATGGRPSGSVLNFGRYSGWSIGQIANVDPGYIEWLLRAPIGRPYVDEVDVLLRKLGRITDPAAAQKERRGLFRRR